MQCHFKRVKQRKKVFLIAYVIFYSFVCEHNNSNRLLSLKIKIIFQKIHNLKLNIIQIKYN